MRVALFFHPVIILLLNAVTIQRINDSRLILIDRSLFRPCHLLFHCVVPMQIGSHRHVRSAYDRRTFRMNMLSALLSAIIEDEVATAKRLLKADPTLARALIPKPKLHRSGIFHWIYARDTPLHLAAAGYRVEIARLLLQTGADPNAAHNMRKSSPLHYAADGCVSGPAFNPDKQVETLRLLLDGGADMHLQDMNGATALHRAVRTRCAAAVEFLLGRGSDPLMRNKPGSTPFHLAVQNTGRGGSGAPEAIAAQREIIAGFLSRRMNPRLKTTGGKTVFDCARSPWIREMLQA